jgi:hypothetical protein
MGAMQHYLSTENQRGSHGCSITLLQCCVACRASEIKLIHASKYDRPRGHFAADRAGGSENVPQGAPTGKDTSHQVRPLSRSR